MSIIVHVNRFILQNNREKNRQDPAYCIHGPEADGYPFLGHFHEVRGKGDFYFTPGKLVPVPEPDTPAGATHVMVLEEGCELYGDDGERWVKIGLDMRTGGETRNPRALLDVTHDEYHIHQDDGGRQWDHRHEHIHAAADLADGRHRHEGDDHRHAPEKPVRVRGRTR